MMGAESTHKRKITHQTNIYILILDLLMKYVVIAQYNGKSRTNLMTVGRIHTVHTTINLKDYTLTLETIHFEIFPQTYFLGTYRSYCSSLFLRLVVTTSCPPFDLRINSDIGVASPHGRLDHNERTMTSPLLRTSKGKKLKSSYNLVGTIKKGYVMLIITRTTQKNFTFFK